LDGVKIGARWVLYGWCVKRFQIIEKDLDALMDRTKNRPVPTGRMSSGLRLLLQVFDGYWNYYSIINPKPLCLALFQYFYTLVFTL
jgi:protoheme IX farnesyltransferase